MERLNDIMGRNAQRRQPLPAQRPPQAISHLGPRAPQQQQPQQPVARAPLSEQRSRQRQQTPVTGLRTNQKNYAPFSQHQTNDLQNPNDAHSFYSNERENRQYNNPPSRPPLPGYNQRTNAPRHTVMDSSTTYQAHTRTPLEADTKHTQQRASRPANDYYDDYLPAPEADVIEEWEGDEEEEEEDSGGMGYGDWEQDEREVIVYKSGDVGIVTEHRTQYPSSYRENLKTDGDPAARNPRDLHAYRLPTTIPAQLPPPTTHRPHDLRRYQQRTTQPLQPHTPHSSAAPGIEREQIAVQPEYSPRPVRPVETREQLQRPLPAPPVTKYICPRCKGAGYLRADVDFGHPDFGKPVACECKKAENKSKRRQQLRDISNLDAFHNQNFNSFNPRVSGVQEALQAALEFAENPYGWLLLIGPNGCGKTHLAAAIANEGLDAGMAVLFEAVPDLLDHLRAAFAPTASEVYDQLFAKMREAELLVLDDLGAQQSSPWANEKLFQLLNYRYNMGMPTVITANPKGLQGIDERIRSRLSDNSLVTSITFDRARDYRPNQPRRR